MKEYGFSQQQMNPWKQLLNSSTAEDTLAVLIGARCHLYFVIKNSRYGATTKWIKELEPYNIAHYFRQKHSYTSLLKVPLKEL